MRRTLSKVQYRVHTDAVQQHLIPAQLTPKEAGFVYASEADVLNKALFGMTAAEWKRANPDAKGNLRDNATMEQLVVMSSIESQNALLIQQGFLSRNAFKCSMAWPVLNCSRFCRIQASRCCAEIRC